MADQFQFTGDPQFFSEVEDFRQEIFEVHDRQDGLVYRTFADEAEVSEERPEQLVRTLPDRFKTGS